LQCDALKNVYHNERILNLTLELFSGSFCSLSCVRIDLFCGPPG